MIFVAGSDQESAVGVGFTQQLFGVDPRAEGVEPLLVLVFVRLGHRFSQRYQEFLGKPNAFSLIAHFLSLMLYT